MKRLLRRLVTGDDGNTSLEFAFAGSVFVLLAIFILEAGLLLWANSAMQTAASQTARCVAVGSSACTSANTPQSYASSLLSAWGVAGLVSPVSVSVQSNSTCNSTVGRFTSVTISSSGSKTSWLMPPLAGLVLKGDACYPSGT